MHYSGLKSGLFRPFLEILAILTIPLFIMWVLPFLVHDRAVFARTMGLLTLGGLFIAAFICRSHHDGPHQVGFRVDNFLDASRPLAAFTLSGIALLMGIGFSCGSVRLGGRFAEQMMILPFWGMAQQYGIQGVVNRRLQSMLGSGWSSSLLTGLIFSALHLPKPTLTLATLIAGIVWSFVYQRFPNLYAIALSHALLSASLANSFPVWLLPNMKAGLGYFGTVPR